MEIKEYQGKKETGIIYFINKSWNDYLEYDLYHFNLDKSYRVIKGDRKPYKEITKKEYLEKLKTELIKIIIK